MSQFDRIQFLNNFKQINEASILTIPDTLIGHKEHKFDESLSFIGLLFNFNVWDKEKDRYFISNLFNDCKLEYCGDAIEWSDFRQGTRGDVKMYWPTEILWKSN